MEQRACLLLWQPFASSLFPAISESTEKKLTRPTSSAGLYIPPTKFLTAPPAPEFSIITTPAAEMIVQAAYERNRIQQHKESESQ
ncbi:hypothetical protein ACNR9V_04210 [Parageobacillus thermoglucosidasius]|uniref:hypothetical protein n=1 Tax=Parageobacillus thermoglucosidasius TaxID=1426 RepID=UPI003B677AE5